MHRKALVLLVSVLSSVLFSAGQLQAGKLDPDTSKHEEPSADEGIPPPSAASSSDNEAGNRANRPAPTTPSFQGVRSEERDARPGTSLIMNKLYPMQGRFEFSGFYDISFADKYLYHQGGHGSVGYHIFDWLNVEAFGGYLAGEESKITKTVRIEGQSHNFLVNKNPVCQQNGSNCEPQLPDLWQTTWFAGAGVQWAPIYGKISVFSEYDLSFQLYGLLGGAVEGIHKQLNGPGADGSGFSPMQLRPSANYGIGFRFIPWRWVALRLELRNYTGVNPNVVDLEREGECTNGYVLTVNKKPQCLTDFTTNSLFQVGLSFLL